MNSIGEMKRDNGMMRGIVVNVNDSMLEGRVAIMVPKMLTKFDPADVSSVTLKESINKDNMKNADLAEFVPNEVETTNSIWFRPKFMFSFEVPSVGDVVDCFFEDGDVQKPYYFPTKCTLNGEVTPMENIQHTSDRYDVGSKPKVRVMAEYPDGTIVYYNENDAHKMFSIKFSSGYEFSLKDNNAEQQILLSTKNGNKFVIDELAKKITLNSAGGNSITMQDEDGVISINSLKGSSLKLNEDIQFQSSDGSIIKMANNIKVSSASGSSLNLSSAISAVSSEGGELMITDEVRHTIGDKPHKV